MIRAKRLLGLVLTGGLCFGMVFQANASSISDAQKKAQELESQKKAAEEEKNSLSVQLNTIISEMEKIKEKVAAKEAEIEKKEDELIQAKVDENTQYQSMKKRIKYMYENGNAQFIEILCESKSIGDFLNNAEYISTISSYDRDMLVEFQKVVKNVEEQEAALKGEYEKLSAMQEELVAKQDNVKALLESKSAQISDLDVQIGENASKLAELKAAAEEAARKQQEQAAAAAASSGSSGNSGGGSYTAPGPSVSSGSGRFTHPCPGAGAGVTSEFGEYRDPSDPSHKGMDFGTNGAMVPTYAADAGTVVIAGYSSSAGNWVVIDHGGGLTTKYMHHSSLCVSQGQTVSRGQQIGVTGNTGNSFGIHLHFQVEQDGVAVNPRNYL